MEASTFTDYYEILEISSNANSETIDRIFRYLAQRYHPDNQDTGDRLRFEKIVQANNTLRDPVTRAQYDIQYKNHSDVRWKLAEEASDSRAAWGAGFIVVPLCAGVSQHPGKLTEISWPDCQPASRSG
jgi:DnaJ-class molecular chaperone